MDEAILLGIPAQDVHVDETCPYTAKLGGVPAWFSEATSFPESQLVCPKCQSQLFLVAQVYAPVTSPRTLYIFGCNSSKCGDSPNSWRVFRFQIDEAEVESVEPVAVAAPPPHAAAGGGWGADSDDDDDDDGWGDASTSAWGAAVPTTSNDDVDLEELLKVRDTAMVTTVKASASSTRVETKAATPTPTYHGPSFPSIYLNVDDEPAASGVQKYNHETQLLNAYLAEEEKENASEVARLRTMLKSKTDVVAPSEGQGGEYAESYERTPLREKLFLKFQKRIKRSPNQCLRYNYGGQPLWPSPPPKLVVPNCTCGEPRTFEMQLMPMTNYFLKVENYVQNPIDLTNMTVDETTTRPTSRPAVLDGGMDWQTVAIWSCPSSCPTSHEEFVYVMPPLAD
ncbi:Aste57867_13990 [Aphanomyces stellatus]|uniref:Aste57867_13990 protein n=1 Tax=Aphanomyces stellatus TaxID=120398 RepID=A0A485L176_9STRA|nr:hypothetical protein As57867_013939 [Aphanomyces stellatus]VFT90820.1 Aste57867_13990 [Aphanomyces stellatus]